MHLPCPYFQPRMKYLLFDSSNQILYHCMSKNIPSSSLPSGSIAIIIIIIINPQKVPSAHYNYHNQSTKGTPLHIHTNTLPAKHRHVPVCSVLIHNLEQLHEVKASEREINHSIILNIIEGVDTSSSSSSTVTLCLDSSSGAVRQITCT